MSNTVPPELVHTPEIAPNFLDTGIYDPEAMLYDFHIAFEHFIAEKPSIPDEKTITLRERLIREESEELFKALREGDLVEAADAIGDLLYVVYGTAVSCGIPSKAAMAIVHWSNMTKRGAVKDEGGKTVKPPWYTPPTAQLYNLLEAHGAFMDGTE